MKIIAGIFVTCSSIAICWGVTSVTKHSTELALVKQEQQNKDREYSELRADAQRKYDELIARAQRIEAKLLIIERKLPQ